MSDLNIFSMINGSAPGYADEKELYAQRLAVLIMVSDDDIGRSYGGELASLPGKLNINSDTIKAEIAGMLQEAVAWMKENDDTVPDDFAAELMNVYVTTDSLSIEISTTTDGVSYTPSTIRLW